MRILAFCLSVILTPLAASASNLGFGLGVGTLGGEVHAAYRLTNFLDVTASFSSYEYEDDFKDEDRNEFTATADINVPRVGLQFFPFGNGRLHFEAGVALDSPEIKVTAKPDENARFNVGGVTYTQAAIGTLTGTVDFDDGNAPYFLIGLGRHIGGGFAWNMSLGAVNYGKPKAKLSTDCEFDLLGDPINTLGCSGIKAALVDEEAKVNDDLEDFELWPIIRIGLSYSF